jgi:acyl-CoA synthetase (NDP forming)
MGTLLESNESDLTLVNRTLQTIIEDPGVDCVAMINASLQGEIAKKIATEIAGVQNNTDKPVFVCWSARDEMAPEAYAILGEARIPHYKSPVRCGRALAAVSWYAEAKRRTISLRWSTVATSRTVTTSSISSALRPAATSSSRAR